MPSLSFPDVDIIIHNSAHQTKNLGWEWGAWAGNGLGCGGVLA